MKPSEDRVRAVESAGVCVDFEVTNSTEFYLEFLGSFHREGLLHTDHDLRTHSIESRTVSYLTSHKRALGFQGTTGYCVWKVVANQGYLILMWHVPYVSMGGRTNKFALGMTRFQPGLDEEFLVQLIEGECCFFKRFESKEEPNSEFTGTFQMGSLILKAAMGSEHVTRGQLLVQQRKRAPSRGVNRMVRPARVYLVSFIEQDTSGEEKDPQITLLIEFKANQMLLILPQGGETYEQIVFHTDLESISEILVEYQKADLHCTV